MNKNFLQKSLNSVNIVNTILKDKNLIQQKSCENSIIISISGGQDSVCLLFIIWQLKTQWKLTLHVVWCNHLWQKDSFYVMKTIFNLMYRYKVFSYFTLNLEEVYTEQKARLWRYFSYERMSAFYNIKIIASGHTASDRIETLLFHFFRGSGTQGLHSLYWQKFITFNITKKFFFNLKNENKIFFYCNKIYVSLYTYNTKKNYEYKSEKKLSFWLKRLKQQNQLVNKLENFKFHSQTQNLLDLFQLKKNKQRLSCKTKKFYRKFYFYEYIFIKDFIPLKQNINFQLKHHFYIIENKIYFKKIVYFTTTTYKLEKIKIFFYKSQKIEKKEKISLIRPLLNFSRTDITKLCNFWKLPFYPDKSNQHLNYSRNRIRKQILPTIRFFFNPQIDNILNQFSEMANLEQKYLELITHRLRLEGEIKTETTILFKISILKFIPITFQRRIIRQYLEKFLNKKVQFFHIETLLEVISKKNDFTSKNISLNEVEFQEKKPGHKVLLLQNKKSFPIIKEKSLKFDKGITTTSNLRKNKLNFEKKYVIFPKIGMIQISSLFLILCL
jgi:tRNA(Ile)-lysidine synthetase-like protein